MSLPLTLSRTYPDHHNAAEREAFWSVVGEGVNVGSIVLHKGRSDEPPAWRWVVNLHAGRHGNGMPCRDGSAESREAAMAAFREAFGRCLAHIGEEGWQTHLDHMEVQQERRARGNY
jgi:hypothetical protein